MTDALAFAAGLAAADLDAVSPVEVAPVRFADLGPESLGGPGGPSPLARMEEVEIEIAVELGRRRLPLAEILRLNVGSVVELDRMLGEPLGVYANGHLVAEGEAVVLGEQFAVRVTRLVAAPRGA